MLCVVQIHPGHELYHTDHIYHTYISALKDLQFYIIKWECSVDDVSEMREIAGTPFPV